jgi:hypothetical protein
MPDGFSLLVCVMYAKGVYIRDAAERCLRSINPARLIFYILGAHSNPEPGRINIIHGLKKGVYSKRNTACDIIIHFYRREISEIYFSFPRNPVFSRVVSNGERVFV